MGDSKVNEENIFKGFALVLTFALSTWILISPLSLLFKVSWVNYCLHMLTSVVYPYKKYPKYKYWQIAWGILSILLLLFHTLVETGRM